MGKGKDIGNEPGPAIDIAQSTDAAPPRRRGKSSTSTSETKSGKDSLAPPTTRAQKTKSWGSDLRKSVIQRVPPQLRKKKELRNVVVYERAWPVDRARVEKSKGANSIEVMVVLDKPEAAKSLGTTAERTRLCDEYSAKLKADREEFFKKMVESEFNFSKEVIYLDKKLKLKCKHNKKLVWKRMKEQGKKPSEIRERVMQEKAYLIVESRTSVKHKREANLMKQLEWEKETYADRKAEALELEDRISIIELQNLQAKDFGVRTHDHYKELLIAAQKERRFVIKAHYRDIEKEIQVDIKRINDRKEKRKKAAQKAKEKRDAKKKKLKKGGKATKRVGSDDTSKILDSDHEDIDTSSDEEEAKPEEKASSSKKHHKPESKLTPVATLGQDTSINSYTPAANTLQPWYTNNTPSTVPRPNQKGLSNKPSSSRPRNNVPSKTVPPNGVIVQKNANLTTAAGALSPANSVSNVIKDPKGVVIDTKGVQPVPRARAASTGQKSHANGTSGLNPNPNPTAQPRGNPRSNNASPNPSSNPAGRSPRNQGARLRAVSSSAVKASPTARVRASDNKLRTVASTSSPEGGISGAAGKRGIRNNELQNQDSDQSLTSMSKHSGRGGSKIAPPDSNQYVPPVRPRGVSQEL